MNENELNRTNMDVEGGHSEPQRSLFGKFIQYSFWGFNVSIPVLIAFVYFFLSPDQKHPTEFDGWGIVLRPFLCTILIFIWVIGAVILAALFDLTKPKDQQ